MFWFLFSVLKKKSLFLGHRQHVVQTFNFVVFYMTLLNVSVRKIYIFLWLEAKLQIGKNILINTQSAHP